MKCFLITIYKNVRRLLFWNEKLPYMVSGLEDMKCCFLKDLFILIHVKNLNFNQN